MSVFVRGSRSGLVQVRVPGSVWVMRGFKTIKTIFQRIFEFSLILVILPLALPIFLALALTIRIGSPGPVLLRLNCIGADGRIFPRYRFRSVFVDARARAFRADCDGLETSSDPRVTPIGAFMLRSGLNRLPQLLNVLRGDVSLFGDEPQPLAAVAVTACPNLRGARAIRS